MSFKEAIVERLPEILAELKPGLAWGYHKPTGVWETIEISEDLAHRAAKFLIDHDWSLDNLDSWAQIVDRALDYDGEDDGLEVPELEDRFDEVAVGVSEHDKPDDLPAGTELPDPQPDPEAIHSVS